MVSKHMSVRMGCSWLLAVWVFLSAAGMVFGEEAAAPTAGTAAPAQVPSLAEVVYQAGALGQRLNALTRRLEAVDGLDKVETRLKAVNARADLFQGRLAAINADDLQSYQQLAALKGEVREEADAVQQLVDTLTESVQRVEGWRRSWIAEKERWQAWRASLVADLGLKSVADALDRADTDIDQALDLIARKLEPMLAVQQRTGETGARIDALNNRIDAILDRQRGGTLRGGTPNLFSTRYVRQLIEVMHAPEKIITTLPLPAASFFRDKGWVLGAQVALFVLLFSLIRRHRSLLLGQASRRFLGRRQIAVPLFVALFTLGFLYGPQPPAWRMLIHMLAGVAIARLASALVHEVWIKWAITILVLVVIQFQVLLVLNLPLALMRLFILFWTLAGLVYFGWRVRKAQADGKPPWQVWLLRLIVLMFALIAVADVIGFAGLAVQMMDSGLRTVVLLFMGWAMIRLVRVALEIGAESLPMDKLPFLRTNANMILSRVMGAVNVVIIAFVAANLLVAWKLFALPAEAVHAFFAFGFTLGDQEISVGLVLVAGLILYGAFVFSWTLQTLLMQKVLSRGQMDTGARISIARLVHYALVLVGFLIALSTLGFELQNVTIIGGALGVGIGFGMQAIVNNFVSGLILLFERPIKVGDVIQLGDGQQGRVTHLGLRATTVQTFDRAEVVVPNGDLISSQVTNWTLGDRSMRLIVPVGVAYGSDVETVMRVLMTVAQESDRVLKEPQPVVLFLNFGDSALDFQLRVWISDFNDRRIIQSALIREIDRRFRLEGVEIPFPQRDLHLRSVDDVAADRLTGDTKAPADRPDPAAPTEEKRE